MPVNPNSVLIVEDDTELLRLFKTVVRHAAPHLEVLTAGGGTAALQVLQTITPFIVFLDLSMPQVSGNEVLEYLAKEARLQETHVVVLTASPDRLRHDLKGRVSEIFSKPISTRDLEQLIRDYFGLDAKGTAPPRTGWTPR
jgi:CheY-like chemotaxis protein